MASRKDRDGFKFSGCRIKMLFFEKAQCIVMEIVADALSMKKAEHWQEFDSFLQDMSSSASQLLWSRLDSACRICLDH